MLQSFGAETDKALHLYNYFVSLDGDTTSYFIEER